MTAACGTGPRIGSLCTGFGGLDMAARAVLGGELAWVADPDPGASVILAHHHPTVPNYGDIAGMDWSTIAPVDVITAGFPCQDISNAGRRAGIEGARSGIWPVVAHAVRVVRPRLVVLENVAALTVRGLDTVLADLAALGLDAEWGCVRASDVGAPHRRERWFCIAWPAHPQGPGLEAWRKGRLGGVAAADAADLGHERGGRARGGWPGPAHGGAPAADAPGDGRQQRWAEPAGLGGGSGTAGVGSPAWGPYAAAVARWERLLGRPAPPPTEPTGRRRAERLSPAFVEWLMGLPDGHVAAVPGLTRTQQLRALGNGVVPQQGAMALRALLDRASVAA